MGQTLQDIIDQAIYGVPEVKPEERRLFLSTILERIHLALTKKQVIQTGMYAEALTLFKTKSNLHIYINGDLNYQNYANYVKEAGKLGIPFTVVTPPKPTPFGLVIADKSKAIHAASVFIEDELYKRDMEESEK
ncbi:YueI family protein [bacterium LRH843]|nr:YueI family protein [bacterium LRH843]